MDRTAASDAQKAKFPETPVTDTKTNQNAELSGDDWVKIPPPKDELSEDYELIVEQKVTTITTTHTITNTPAKKLTTATTADPTTTTHTSLTTLSATAADFDVDVESLDEFEAITKSPKAKSSK